MGETKLIWVKLLEDADLVGRALCPAGSEHLVTEPEALALVAWGKAKVLKNRDLRPGRHNGPDYWTR